MDSATTYEHITRHEEVLSGEPIIDGTRTPVRAIVEEWRRGTPPEEIPEGMPHLSLAQVFAALAYYIDHQDEINALIERNRMPEAQLGSSVSGDERSQHSQNTGPSS